MSTICVACTETRFWLAIHHFKHYWKTLWARMQCIIINKRQEDYSCTVCSLCTVSLQYLYQVQQRTCMVAWCNLWNKSLRSTFSANGWKVSKNLTYTLCYFFTKKETTVDYGWAMDKMKNLFNDCGIDHQLAFVTDRELALMNALSTTFPTANALLCRSHISKNIFDKQRTAFFHRSILSVFFKTGEGSWMLSLKYHTKESSRKCVFICLAKPCNIWQGYGLSTR